MTTTVDTLWSAGNLSPLDRHFARTLGATLDEQREPVLVAAALASRSVGQGHVCLDLAGLVEAGLAQADAPGEPPALPGLDAWLDALHSSPLVARLDAQGADDAESAGRPLVLDAAGRLYLRRYWDLQARLARQLLARASHPVSPGDAAAKARIEAGLERLFPAPAPAPSSPPHGVDLQRAAAACALAQRLCVITGGPGTGKTSTVARLLALIVEEALARGERTPRIHLVAPTGKAAARLGEALRAALASLADSPARAALQDLEAMTIHRCLGRAPDGRLRHDAARPLATDLLLVDEASMVDLALMTRLVEACPAEARLILMGDADQLASVEAGAVLGDIGGRRRAAGAPEAGPLVACRVGLTKSYRYAPDSGLAALAAAVRDGDAAAALRILDDPGMPDVRRVSPARGLGEALRAEVLAGYADFLAAQGAAAKLAALERFRVLCAHRRGPDGVEALNTAIEACLARQGRLRPTPGDYPGRPILVTRNHHELQLYNGDVGVIAAPDGATRGALRACFRAGDGGLRSVSHRRLADHETVFAMSVHKSQGSEFDRVAVILPEAGSAILSRELVYTAISRAREQVTLHARPEVLRAAIERGVERASGLGDLLWPAVPPDRQPEDLGGRTP